MTVIGVKTFEKKIDNLIALADDRNMTKALFAGGLVLEGKTKVNIQRQKLIDTGALRSSVVTEIAGKAVYVFTNIIYAAIHEFGGMAGRGRKVRIPARPYFRPAIDDNLRTIANTIADVLFEAMKRVI